MINFFSIRDQSWKLRAALEVTPHQDMAQDLDGLEGMGADVSSIELTMSLNFHDVGCAAETIAKGSGTIGACAA